jgi:membrane protein YqaA with SNARE-associated domain
MPVNDDDSVVAEESARGKTGVIGWLRRRIVPIAGMLLVIAIVVTVFYIKAERPELIDDLKNYGYAGAFIVSVIFNATLILPAGNMLIQMALGATVLSPVLVGLIGGAGATIGETTGYLAGRSGRGLLARSKMYTRVEGWLQKWGMLTIFVFSIVPFVFDLVGIAAGALRFPFWKFFLACMLGRILLYTTMVWLASLGYETFIDWFS